MKNICSKCGVEWEGYHDESGSNHFCKLDDIIKKNVTEYIALSLERSLSDHGITQCTIKMDIDACMRKIKEALNGKENM